MRTLTTLVARAEGGAVNEAARVLAAGGLVAFPTETVYGLGADATSDAATARLFAAKERPSFNPLIVHVADLDAARGVADFSAAALALAETFWPGPLTLVLRRRSDCPVGMLASAGLDTVAVRVPAHPVARGILDAFGGPVAAPSANRSGRVSPTTAQHVAADFDGRIDMIIDDGPSRIGMELTVLACLDGVVLLRPGAIRRGDLASVLGHAVAAAGTGAEDAVQLPSHAAAGSRFGDRPACRSDQPVAGRCPPVCWPRIMRRAHSCGQNALWVAPGEALLAFGPVLPADAINARAILNLSTGGHVIEAAANLFAYLRRLDESGAHVIAVMPIPEHGLGEAINDRLRRAAAPRGPQV